MTAIRFSASFITIMVFTVMAFSQTYFFDTYSVKEGLAQSKVYCMYQDTLGYLWLGTASGVSKFDGHNFINFTSDDGLSENGVRVIVQGPGGYLWFGHNGGGISREKNGRFEKITGDSLNIQHDITAMLVDYQKGLWIGSHGEGAFYIKNPASPHTNDFAIEHYAGYNKLSDRVLKIFQGQDSTIYFIIDANIIIKEKFSDIFQIYAPEGLSKYFQFTAITQDKKGNLWFGTYNGGLYVLYKQSGKITTFDIRDGLASNFICALYCDHSGNIWAGTWGGGITRINEKMKIYDTSNGLPENKIWSILEDKEGNILIGTNENGFCIFKGDQFVTWSVSDGLVSDHVNALLPIGDNTLWIGTGKGINIYNNKSLKPETLQHKGYPFEKDVVFLKNDYRNHIWIATRYDGIYDYSIQTRQIEYNPMLNIYIMNGGGVITALETDKTKGLWIGTIDGLIFYDLVRNQLDRVMGNEITSLYCDSENTLWIGVKSKGIIQYKNKEFVKLDTLWKFSPLSFTEDRNKNIWVGTDGQGLKVIRNDSTLRQFKISEGLLSDYISLIMSDAKDNIWIGTNRGLNRYNQKTGNMFTYTQENGFTGIEVKHQAGCITKEGQVWFGTVKGAVKYNPDAERIDTVQPLLHFTDLKINLRSRPVENNLELKHTENAVYISFNCINLTNPDLVAYQVMLEGADHSWSQPVRQNFKNYPLLPPGNYVFKVKATNGSGLWNEKPLELAFSILPPFYKRWWFVVSCIFIVAAIIIAVVINRERKLKIEKAILEEKVRERTAEIVKINHELALKNKNITDSIQYAKHIQDAILPTTGELSKLLPELFILYKPKDIVSGDFYWLENKNGLIMLAVVDCTGHGVPGALMSIIGYNGLNRAVREFGNTRPGNIMDKLNDLVQETLKQSENTGVKDGMDMSMCVYDIQNRKLEFAGANNPIYIISGKNKSLEENGIILEPELVLNEWSLFEIKVNRQPIGAYYDKVPFENHTIEPSPGDTVYLFSDGFPDQFGGPKGKKLMYRRFKELIISVQHLPMKNQKEAFNTFIEEWKGDLEQLDDICLIGLKII